MSPAAQRQFSRLDTQLQSRIIGQRDDLVSGAPNVDIEKLGGKGGYRLRVGSYRVVCEAEPDQTFVVTKFGDRKDAYR